MRNCSPLVGIQEFLVRMVREALVYGEIPGLAMTIVSGILLRTAMSSL